MSGRHATTVTPIRTFPHQGGRGQTASGHASHANPHPRIKCGAGSDPVLRWGRLHTLSTPPRRFTLTLTLSPHGRGDQTASGHASHANPHPRIKCGAGSDPVLRWRRLHSLPTSPRRFTLTLTLSPQGRGDQAASGHASHASPHPCIKCGAGSDPVLRWGRLHSLPTPPRRFTLTLTLSPQGRGDQTEGA